MGHSGPIIGILYDAEGKALDGNQTYAKLQAVDPRAALPLSRDVPLTTGAASTGVPAGTGGVMRGKET